MEKHNHQLPFRKGLTSIYNSGVVFELSKARVAMMQIGITHVAAAVIIGTVLWAILFHTSFLTPRKKRQISNQLLRIASELNSTEAKLAFNRALMTAIGFPAEDPFIGWWVLGALDRRITQPSVAAYEDWSTYWFQNVIPLLKEKEPPEFRAAIAPLLYEIPDGVDHIRVASILRRMYEVQLPGPLLT